VDGGTLAKDGVELAWVHRRDSCCVEMSEAALISIGPLNAFWTVTCWSSANPTSKANGSSASMRSASGSPVNGSMAGGLVVSVTDAW
jgi:hypothetical protein